MRIEIDENNRVVQWSEEDEWNELLFEVPDDILPKDFEEDAFYYKYEDGKFIFDPEYKEEIETSQKKVEIRTHRERTCFPVINRGQAWYDTLSEEEKADLAEWYQAWLDAPDTMTEPPTPEWLKGV